MPPRRRLAILIGLLLLGLASRASARMAISEVLWAGSDLSSADEWVEVACVVSQPHLFAGAESEETQETQERCNIGGWTLTSMNSEAEEAMIFRFATGATLVSGQFAVIANAPADQSRLSLDPWAVASSISLPNSKLLLRLRDGGGAMHDQIDDGVGVPFAGANKMTTGSGFVWASMERLDLAGSGSLKGNWKTTSVSRGFDEGSPMRGTPGFANASGSFILVPNPQSPLSRCPRFDTSIVLQSGNPVTEEKVTVNVQAVSSGASLSSLRCHFDFSDGTRLDTCNPPSHTFLEPGIHTITLRATDRCGQAIERRLDVEVLQGRAVSPERYLPPACRADTLAARDIVISELLPDPTGDDAQGEWIELKNTGAFHLQLCGLALQGNAAAIYPLDDVVLDAGDTIVLPRLRTGVALGNAGGRVRLLLRSKDGTTHVVQEMTYDAAPKGRRFCRNDDGRYAWSFQPASVAFGPPVVVISAVMPSPRGADAEWVELVATSPTSVDLSGWSIVFAGSDDPLSLDEVEIVSGHALRIPLSSARNEGGSVQLLDPQGRIVSVAAWNYAEEDVIVRPFHAGSKSIFGRVDYVFDGDTLSVLIANSGHRAKSVRVRMIGIDAPETTDDFADASSDALRDLVLGKDVRLEFDGADQDVYGRLLAYVFQNGRDIQAQMIASGHARAVTEFPFGRREEYAAIEDYARERSAGMWREME